MPRTAYKQYKRPQATVADRDGQPNAQQLIAGGSASSDLARYLCHCANLDRTLAHACTVQTVPWLICKHFNDLFVQHSELSRHILLRPDYPSSCLPSLLGQLHRCRRSTLTMDLLCTDTDVVSRVLQQPLQLKAATLKVVSQATVALLSGLSSLQRCELISLQTDTCLEPMSNLPALKSLKLSGGIFTDLQSFAHLTNLEVLQASASGVVKCQFSSKLRRLVVKNGLLYNIKGLSGCRKLQALTIRGHSCVTSQSASETLSSLSYCLIPQSLSKLSALTKLALDVRPNANPAELAAAAFWGCHYAFRRRTGSLKQFVRTICVAQ